MSHRIRAVKMGNLTQLTRVDHLVSQPNPAHLLASKKNSNPIWPTTGWWVKQVSSRAHLIKKIQFFFIFSVKTKL